jgi:glycopeptide antibiotics resistance protein
MVEMAKWKYELWCKVALFVYIVFVFFITLLSRGASDENKINIYWLWSDKCPKESIIYTDYPLNVLLFVPIGFLVCSITTRFRLIKALLVGLFVSETIECSQLIWNRGTFDVNDLLNNTLGALVGGIIACLLLRRK